MPKKQEKIEEEVVTENQDTALATSASAFEYLMQGIVETEVEQQQKFGIAELHVYMPGKKFTEDGANRGWVISYPDGHKEVNIESLRIARIDAPIMQRLMWEFDPKTGKRIQQDEPKPACASSDGVSARKSDYFGYIGKEFVDSRDGQHVTILPDNCAKCPLGQWKETFSPESGWKEAVIEVNYKGQPYTKRSAPLCAEQPAYVFYDLDRKIPLLYRTANFTAVQWTIGSGGRQNRRWKTVIKGVEEFYGTAKGTKRPDVSPADGVMLPLVATTRMVDNTPFGMTPAPQFALLDKPLDEQEIAEYATAIQLYRTDEIRKVLTGEFWGLSESVANYADEGAATAPPAAESPW